MLKYLYKIYSLPKKKKSVNCFISANFKNKQKDPFWPGGAIAKYMFQLNIAVFTFLDNKILGLWTARR